jgi:archaeoflavoprotein AfpA
MTQRILWGITGCGDYLSESVDVMKALKEKYGLNVDVVLSKAGQLVVKRYKLLDAIMQNFDKVFVEKNANTPFLIGPLQLGKYDFLLLCPASANTVAKLAHGIADSLLTNCAAQAIKAGVHIYVFPVDQKLGKIVTTLPSGKKITLNMRQVDVENAGKLKLMKGMTVLSTPNDVESVISKLRER